MEISKNQDLNEQNKRASPSKLNHFLNKKKWLIEGLIMGVVIFVFNVFFQLVFKYEIHILLVFPFCMIGGLLYGFIMKIIKI